MSTTSPEPWSWRLALRSDWPPNAIQGTNTMQASSIAARRRRMRISPSRAGSVIGNQGNAYSPIRRKSRCSSKSFEVTKPSIRSSLGSSAARR